MNLRISRSALETLFSCETKRYFNYEADGVGYTPNKAIGETDIGIALHDALYNIVNTGDTYTHLPTLGVEENNLIEGLSVTFAKDIFPIMADTYDVVSLEEEWDIPLAEFELQLRFDSILRDKETGKLVIVDYKSTKGLGWVKETKYSFNLQTALYVWALEQKTGEQCEGITYVIFEKGGIRQDKQLGRYIRNSPYLYGFKTEHGSYQASWAKGWTKFPVYDEFETTKWTTDIMTEEERAKTWTVLPKLKLPDNVQELMISNALRKEREFRAKVKAGTYLKDHQSCNEFGVDHRCAYYNVCWNGSELNNENFTEREDHHSPKAAT